MTGIPGSFDATPSLLGYLYQCRFALLRAIESDETSDSVVSIEVLDDIAIESLRETAKGVDLLQLKHHHVKRRAGLGNSSADVWKTIRVWSELIASKTIEVSGASFVFVTTAQSTARNAVKYLRMDDGRDPDRARTELRAAGERSANKVVQTAFKALDALPGPVQKQLFERMILLDAQWDIAELRIRLDSAVRHSVRPVHREAFLDRLEGWWFRVVIEHLQSAAGTGIPAASVHQRIHDLREQFQRETLPDDFLDVTVPSHEVPDVDSRTFVRQLQLLGLSVDRVRSAQVDHYKAFAQRSLWLRDNLLDIDEVEHFEDRLSDDWRQRFMIMLECLASGASEREMVTAGHGLYNWTQTDATSNATLFIRPDFQSAYVTRGSYQMLADQLRVGWHPEYSARLGRSDCREDVE